MSEQILSLSAGLLGAVSSACLIGTFCLYPRLRAYGTTKVFLMALCDLVLSFVMPGLKGWGCTAAGVATNFFLVATCSWYCLIAYDLHRIINGKGGPGLVTWRHHLFTWTPALIATIWPLATGALGTPEQEDWQDCWFKNRNDISKLALVIPITLYVLFAYFLLLEYTIKSYRGFIRSSPVHAHLTAHTLKFSLIFIIVWSWLILSCIEDLFWNSSAVRFVDDVAFYCFKCNGFFNFVVWITSPVFTYARKYEAAQRERSKNGEDVGDEEGEGGFYSTDNQLRRSLLPPERKDKDSSGKGIDPSTTHRGSLYEQGDVLLRDTASFRPTFTSPSTQNIIPVESIIYHSTASDPENRSPAPTVTPATVELEGDKERR